MIWLEGELSIHINQKRDELPKHAKAFTPKYPYIPKLQDYSRAAQNSWWRHWPTLSWDDGKLLKSTINSRKLMIWADCANDPEKSLLKEISKDLTHGCDLGTRGPNLCPSVSTNAPSAYKYGDRVTDSIVDGIIKGILIGPMNEDEIPFESVKVNGIMVTFKDSGAAQVILNLSRGDPFDVNSGMYNDDRFNVTMSSTNRWLRALHSAGVGCFIVKLDWVAAFKQLRVQHQDVRQQFFCWAGKYFAELCLVFGGSSSVGLFDRLAKRFRYAATKLSNMPPEQVEQIIDDVVAAGTKQQVNRFYVKYREIAEVC